MDSSSGAARSAGVLPSPGLTPSPLGRCGWRGVVLTPFWGKPPKFFLRVPPRHPRGGSVSSEETTRVRAGEAASSSPGILSGGTCSRRLGKHAARSEGRCARRRRAAHGSATRGGSQGVSSLWIDFCLDEFTTNFTIR